MNETANVLIGAYVVIALGVAAAEWISLREYRAARKDRRQALDLAEALTPREIRSLNGAVRRAVNRVVGIAAMFGLVVYFAVEVGMHPDDETVIRLAIAFAAVIAFVATWNLSAVVLDWRDRKARDAGAPKPIQGTISDYLDEEDPP